MRSALIAVLVLLAFAPVATAEPWSWELDGYRYSDTDRPVDGPIAESIAIAVAYWGRDAPGPIRWRQFDATPVGVDTGVSANGFTSGTNVWIRPGLDRVTFCMVVRHEFGHVLGYGHEDYPEDVDHAMHGDNRPGACASLLPAMRPNAKGRKASRRADRVWCARNRGRCILKYPELAIAVQVRDLDDLH